jgi:trehalose/maltose hydrolase-like predicted phosphorylase
MIITKVEEGCHITSMAGTWMSIEGFEECELKTMTSFPNPKRMGVFLKLISETNFEVSIITETISVVDGR